MKLDWTEIAKSLDREMLQEEVIMHPVIVSHITDQTFAKLPLKSIS